MDVDDFDDVSGYIDDADTLPVEGISAFARQLRFSEEGIAAAAEIVSLIGASDGGEEVVNSSVNIDGEVIAAAILTEENNNNNNVGGSNPITNEEAIISNNESGGGGGGGGGANASNTNEPETPIEVYARVRPLNTEERARGASGVSTLRIADERTVITTAPPVSYLLLQLQHRVD